MESHLKGLSFGDEQRQNETSTEFIKKLYKVVEHDSLHNRSSVCSLRKKASSSVRSTFLPSVNQTKTQAGSGSGGNTEEPSYHSQSNSIGANDLENESQAISDLRSFDMPFRQVSRNYVGKYDYTVQIAASDKTE